MFTFLSDPMEKRNNPELLLMGVGEILENPGWKSKTEGSIINHR